MHSGVFEMHQQLCFSVKPKAACWAAMLVLVLSCEPVRQLLGRLLS